MRILWRSVFVVYLIAAVACAGLWWLTADSLGGLAFVVAFFWLGMPWSWLLSLAPWQDQWIYGAFAMAVMMNAGMLWWLAQRGQEAK